MRSFLGVEGSVLNDTQDVMHRGQIPYTLWRGLSLVSVIASAGTLLFRQWGARCSRKLFKGGGNLKRVWLPIRINIAVMRKTSGRATTTIGRYSSVGSATSRRGREGAPLTVCPR
jgi:hypothetical protein